MSQQAQYWCFWEEEEAVTEYLAVSVDFPLLAVAALIESSELTARACKPGEKFLGRQCPKVDRPSSPNYFLQWAATG